MKKLILSEEVSRNIMVRRNDAMFKCVLMIILKRS